MWKFPALRQSGKKILLTALRIKNSSQFIWNFTWICNSSNEKLYKKYKIKNVLFLLNCHTSFIIKHLYYINVYYIHPIFLIKWVLVKGRFRKVAKFLFESNTFHIKSKLRTRNFICCFNTLSTGQTSDWLFLFKISLRILKQLCWIIWWWTFQRIFKVKISNRCILFTAFY